MQAECDVEADGQHLIAMNDAGRKKHAARHMHHMHDTRLMFERGLGTSDASLHDQIALHASE